MERRLSLYSDLDLNNSFDNDTSFPVTNTNTTTTTTTTTSCFAAGVDPTTVIYTTSFLIICCTVSLAINLFILSSVCFLRNKVGPTLYISISLAGADTFSLFLFALGLVLFSLLPRGFSVCWDATCVMLVIEALRMGAILTTMFHLAALAGNCYLGILKPLRYPLYMTRSNVRCMALLLWTIPSILLFMDIIILEGAAYSTDSAYSCSAKFLIKAKFRMTFAIPFFTTLGLMIFIYCHIYVLVDKRHRNQGNIQMGGLQPGASLYCSRASQTSFVRSQVNEKAVITTLMILGSVVCGWLPAFTYFILFCEDCLLSDYWQTHTLPEHYFLVTINFLMISKTATNSYIYACRMKEVKSALLKMKKRALKMFR